MSNVVVLRGERAEKTSPRPGLGPAEVLHVTPHELEVRLKNGAIATATLALGYPYNARPGDIVLVIGDVETDRGRRIHGGIGLAERVFEEAAQPEGYRLAGVALDDVAAVRKMTKLWGDEAGRATKTDRLLVLGASDAGRRRALAGAGVDVDWTWPPRNLRSLR